ncbi:MAG: hypothetical protein EB120_08270, partial [Proteobacteria bacterium]|nr:hypothetical protein [Pseudomonadota bacterium]NDG27154.1 hypothetical protein [Pseudomonadota bacterium]
MSHRAELCRRGFSTKGEARAWHDQTTLEFSKNPSSFAKEEKILFDELLDKYVSIHLPTISSISRMRYQVEIIYRIKPFFQYRKLESITPMVIEAYRASIMKKLSMKS